MMFKVGYYVQIVRTGKRPTHECVLNKIGRIAFIKKHAVNTPHEEIAYYVAVDGIRNQNQENGWWCFDEDDLAYIGSNRNCFIEHNMCETKLTCNSLDAVANGVEMISRRYEKIKENNMNILEIYKEKQMNILETKMRVKRERIKMKESDYKDLINLEKELKQLGNERINACIAFNFDYFEFTPQTRRAVDDVLREVSVETQKINNLISEIKAQLELCDTYEQKQNILKAYGVIDETGKLK